MDKNNRLSERLIQRALNETGLAAEIRELFGDADGTQINDLVLNLVASGGASFERCESFGFDPEDDFDDDFEDDLDDDFEDNDDFEDLPLVLADEDFDEDPERTALFRRIARNERALRAFFDRRRNAAGALDAGFFAMEIDTHDCTFLNEHEDDVYTMLESCTDMLYVSRKTRLPVGYLELSRLVRSGNALKGADALRKLTGAEPTVMLNSEHDLSEILGMMREGDHRILCRVEASDALAEKYASVVRQKLHDSPEVIREFPQVVGVTDVAFMESGNGGQPIRVSFVNNVGFGDYEGMLRERLDGIRAKLGRRGNSKKMSEEEKELAAKFLVREPMKKGGGFSWRLNEPAIAEACEQRGWQWYLSNFPVTAAELWSLEAQRRSSGEFMSAEFYDICADDYLPPVFYTVGAAEKNGCNFVKFCALICSEGLRRIFEDARARVAEIARQSPVEPGIERVKSNLEFDSHMSMLDTCDLYEDEPKEFGAEFKLMQRIFLETEAA